MSGTRRLGFIVGLGILVAVACAPSTRVLGAEWTDFANLTYTHGWLILAVCVGLLWRARREIGAAPVQPSFRSLAALVLGSICWLVAWRACIQDLHVILLPALFWLATRAAFGWPVARLVLFPALFFYFAIPSWSQLAAPLQALTVLAMRGVMALTGPAAVIDGDRIHIPNGVFVVEEGCSGLHFMIVGLAIAALHGELERDRGRVRAAQLAIMAGLALLANWARVYVIILVGYFTDMHSGLLPNHYWFGWGVFAVALFAFFRLVRRLPATSGSAAPPPAPPPAPHPVPQPRAERRGFLLAAGVVVGVPLASAALRAAHPAEATGPPPDLAVRPPWTRALIDVHSSWQPRFVNPLWQQRLAFAAADGSVVEVYRVGYGTQTQDAKLVSGRNTLTGDTLASTPPRRVTTPVGAFRESKVAEWNPPHAQFLIWVRYRTDGRVFSAPLPAQLWYGIVATVGSPALSLEAFRTACRPDCGAARERLAQLLQEGAAPARRQIP